MAAGADVVGEAGQRERRRTRTAADLVACLEHADTRATLRQRDRRCEAVRTGADDDGVVAHCSSQG